MLKKEKNRGLLMGAVAVSVFVSLVAIVDFIYFSYKEKRKLIKQKDY